MHLGGRGVLTLKREKIVQVHDRRLASFQKEAPAGLSASTTRGSTVHTVRVSAASGAPAAHGDGCRPAGVGSTHRKPCGSAPPLPFLSPPSSSLISPLDGHERQRQTVTLSAQVSGREAPWACALSHLPSPPAIPQRGQFRIKQAQAPVPALPPVPVGTWANHQVEPHEIAFL